MPVTVPVTVKSAPLPSNFKGTLQQLQDALTSRLYLETSLDSVSLVAQGATAPTSNQGPWFKDGTTLYVWNDVNAAYEPASLEFQSLKYVASSTAPDPDIYTLWIRTDSITGKALEIMYWSGSPAAWKNVYDDTVLALIEQIDNVEQQYPFRGDATADQDINSHPSGEAYVIFTETFDPGNVFNSSAFTAPVAGYYQINLRVAVELTSGTPVDNTVIVWLVKNGAKIATEFSTSPIITSHLGLRTLSLSSIVSLAQNDAITILVETTASSAAQWTVKKDGTSISGHRVFTYIP